MLNNNIDKFLNKDKEYTEDYFLELLNNNEICSYLDNITKDINYIKLKKIPFNNINIKRLIKIYLIINSKNNIQNKYNILNKDMDDNYFNEILEYIRNYRFIDTNFTKRLIEEYNKNNDNNLKDIIIYSNQYIIIKYILSLTTDKILIQDLIQEGNIGLLKALSKYGINSDLPFHYFAYWYVRVFIDNYFYNNNKMTVKSTKNIELTNNIKKYIQEYEIKYLKSPSIEEIINYFDISKKRYNNLMLSEDINSLNTKNDEEDELIDYICYEKDLIDKKDEEQYVKTILNEMSKIINNDAIEIINKKLGLLEEEKKFIEIARDLGVTKQAVSQKYLRALDKIKKSDKIKKLIKE